MATGKGAKDLNTHTYREITKEKFLEMVKVIEELTALP
jgi:hypothetical protein